MGLFGKLFDKKQCSICGADIGLLGNRKLEDGNLCKDCARKLSPYFDDRRHSTVEQIQDHLAYRERNRQELMQFRPSVILGNCAKIHIEMVNGVPMRFVVSSDDDYRSANADIVLFKNVANCRVDIRESRNEQKYRNQDGENVSYNPPRYEYNYDFYIRLDIANCPYYDDISFKVNPRSVELQTVEQNNIFSSFTSSRTGFDPMLYPVYREYKAMCDEIVQYIVAGQRGSVVNTQMGNNLDLNNVISQIGAQLAGGFAGASNVAQTNSQMNQTPVTNSVPTNTWRCSCGTENTGKFCQSCGSPKVEVAPASQGWKCICGNTNTGKFCSNCGKPQVTIEDIECSACSWTAEPGLTTIPAFCPNCGKRFDENDIR